MSVRSLPSLEGNLAVLSKDQTQEVASGGAALQAGGDITINTTGLSYSEVRDVALDVFRANFYELAGAAKETARARAEEITEEFLSKLQKEHPAGFDKANDPDFQYAVFSVQKEFAKTGDKDLGDLLVDLLVDRSKQQQRDILQIVLNESLTTAPKLTEAQLAALAIIFLFKHTQNHAIGNHVLLGQHFDRNVKPFVDKLVPNAASYQHLEFCGCGSIGIGIITLEAILGQIYQGQFLKGFDEGEIASRNISIGTDPRFFLKCLNDQSKLQVRANSAETLDKLLDEHKISPEDRTHIVQLFQSGMMSEPEIRAKCVEIRPYMSTLFDVWSKSAMQNFSLTSVGIAIGHANIKRLVGEFANLAIWIN
jgi:hypothetical protein